MKRQGRAALFMLGVGLIAAHTVAFAAEVSFAPTAGGGRMHSSVKSLQELRWEHVAKQGLDVSCGSAALSTILRYQFNDQVSEKALLKELFTRLKPEEIKKRGGFSLLDLKDVAVKLGYQVKGYKVSFDQLVALNTPAIVPVVIRGTKHFIVFRGVSDNDRVVLADPAFGNTLVSREQFQRLWTTTVALVITKAGVKPSNSKLRVASNDLAAVEPRDAMRSLLNRSATYMAVNPDAL